MYDKFAVASTYSTQNKLSQQTSPMKENGPLTFKEDPYFFSFSKSSPSKENGPLNQEYHLKVLKNKEEAYKFALPEKSANLMEPYEEDELARALKEFIAIDKDLEGIKQILSLKTDFNLEDAWKLFDVENKGTVNLREIEEGFNICNVFPRREEMQLLLLEYDENKDGKLDFKEFCNMILPKDKNYASLVLNRKSFHNG